MILLLLLTMMNFLALDLYLFLYVGLAEEKDLTVLEGRKDLTVLERRKYRYSLPALSMTNRLKDVCFESIRF